LAVDTIKILEKHITPNSKL